MPNPLPALRTGVLSTSELATLWQLPRGRVKHGALLRSTVRRASAPAEIDRDPDAACSCTTSTARSRSRPRTASTATR